MSKYILIIYPVDFDNGCNRGIFEKMTGQGRAFAKLGLLPTYAYLKAKKCILQKDNEETCYAESNSSGWAKYQKLFSTLKRSELKLMEYDMIFIRHLVFTTPLRRFLRQISQYNTKIVCEFPTVPYEHEWTGVMGKILMAIDRRNKQKCLDKIDLVVHYGGFEMQGINNIEISNGIDLDSIQTNEGITKEKSDQVRFVAIGRWAYWHGLDRFIRGMVLIDSEVHLDIVGTGPELMNLNRLVSKLSLSNRITFHEAAFDDRLSELLMNADIGIGTLGLHRKKVARDSSLKHRLYAAYGLPFILSSEDRDFNETESHCFHVEADDDPIDLERIIQQFQSLQRTNSNYRNHIQEWAKEHLTWEKRIKKILETLETI